MFFKMFRVLIVLSLIAGSIYIGYMTSIWIYDLMDFQLTIYEQALKVSQQVDSAKQGILGLFGNAPALDDTAHISTKISNFNEKLVWGSRGVGLLVGLLSWYVSSTFVFGFTRMCKDVKEFVG